ncbi:MAG: hypothetical protein ACLVJH_08790 [Faecalibacterium prausnitzii]
MVRSAACNGGDFDLKLGTLKINRTVCRISCGNGHTSGGHPDDLKPAPPAGKFQSRKQLIADAEKAALETPVMLSWFLSGSESKPTEPRCYRKEASKRI